MDVVAKPFHHRAFLFVVFTRGPSVTLCTRSDSRSVQPSCSFASSSLAERIQPLQDWTSPHSDPRKQPPETRSGYGGTVPCPFRVLNLFWRFGCLLSAGGLQSVLKSSVNLLISSPGLSWRSANSSLNAADSSQLALDSSRSGQNGMTCFARRRTVSSTNSLLSLTSMWYISFLMDEVSSTSSQKTHSIPRCTNVLTNSHKLLLSWFRLQLRGWIPPAPSTSASCDPSARPRHPVR